MTFAKIVFIGAGIWGIVVLTPLYWLVDITGRQYPVPADYPQFYYGFISVAMAWQIGFIVIGLKPARFRPFMIPAVIEKLGYVSLLAVLRYQQRISAADTMPLAPDLVLGILFIVALAKTRSAPVVDFPA